MFTRILRKNMLVHKTAKRFITLMAISVLLSLCGGCVHIKSAETVKGIFADNKADFDAVAQYLLDYPLSIYQNDNGYEVGTYFMNRRMDQTGNYSQIVSCETGIYEISIHDEDIQKAVKQLFERDGLYSIGLRYLNGNKQVGFLMSDMTSDEMHGVLYANGVGTPKWIDLPVTYSENIEEEWYYYEVDSHLTDTDFHYDRANSIFARKGK